MVKIVSSCFRKVASMVWPYAGIEPAAASIKTAVTFSHGRHLHSAVRNGHRAKDTSVRVKFAIDVRIGADNDQR
jgi:hypothetical protein